MKKTYVTPEAQKFEFDYSDTVTASYNWELTNITNPWYTYCDSSYKDANGVCGYNGHNISSPGGNYVCAND